MALHDKISGESERPKCRTKESPSVKGESDIFTRAKSQNELMVKARFIEAEETAKSAWPFSEGLLFSTTAFSQ